MEIVIFLAGMLFGALGMFAVIRVIDRQKAQIYPEIYEKMQLQFENLSNKIFKESTNELSSMTKDRMKEILEPFKEKFD